MLAAARMGTARALASHGLGRSLHRRRTAAARGSGQSPGFACRVLHGGCPGGGRRILAALAAADFIPASARMAAVLRGFRAAPGEDSPAPCYPHLRRLFAPWKAQTSRGSARSRRASCVGFSRRLFRQPLGLCARFRVRGPAGCLLARRRFAGPFRAFRAGLRPPGPGLRPSPRLFRGACLRLLRGLVPACVFRPAAPSRRRSLLGLPLPRPAARCFAVLVRSALALLRVGGPPGPPWAAPFGASGPASSAPGGLPALAGGLLRPRPRAQMLACCARCARCGGFPLRRGPVALRSDFITALVL